MADSATAEVSDNIEEKETHVVGGGEEGWPILPDNIPVECILHKDFMLKRCL